MYLICQKLESNKIIFHKRLIFHWFESLNTFIWLQSKCGIRSRSSRNYHAFLYMQVRSTILFSVEVGKLVHVMQKERDLSVLYLSSIGPETKTFLTKRYMETDEQLANLPSWPADLDVYERKHFASQRAFQNFLTRHRNELELLNQTLYDEISFYSDSIKVSSSISIFILNHTCIFILDTSAFGT